MGEMIVVFLGQDTLRLMCREVASKYYAWTKYLDNFRIGHVKKTH